MFNKIKSFSLIAILALCCQANLFAMQQIDPQFAAALCFNILQNATNQNNNQNPNATDKPKKIDPSIGLNTKIAICDKAESSYEYDIYEPQYDTNIKKAQLSKGMLSLQAPSGNYKEAVEPSTTQLKSNDSQLILYRHTTIDANVQHYIKSWNCYPQTHPWNVFALLQKHIDGKKSDVAIYNQLEAKLKALKERDNMGLCILDQDINEAKNLWNQLISLYNYTWLDKQLYPLSKTIDLEKLEYIRNKKLYPLVHSDKYNKQNEDKIDTLFKLLSAFHVEDFSHLKDLETQESLKMQGTTLYDLRPSKPFDCIINPVTTIATALCSKAIFQTTGQAAATVSSLPSILLPTYFKNKNINAYEQATQREQINIAQHITAIKQHKNAIKKHETIAKHVELKTSIQQLKTRKLLNTLKTKN